MPRSIKAFISCAVLVCALFSVAWGEAFGRFSYTDKPSPTGFILAADGFVADHPLADKFFFSKSSSVWHVVESSEFAQTIGLAAGKNNPEKLNVSLTAPGFGIFWRDGFQLILHSTAAPYLSWAEGSVSHGIPTPNVSWVVVSFKDNQPAIVMGFPDKACELKVEGRPGSWRIFATPRYKGWVRFGLLDGLKGNPANSAAALGRLSVLAARQSSLWISKPPHFLKCALTSDSQSVTATWTFDQRGCVLPVAAQFASLGGYPLRILTPTAEAALKENGLPVRVTVGRELTIRFPIRRVPTGRGLSVGEIPESTITTAAPSDIPSVVELGLENLRGSRDAELLKSGEDTLAEYILQANYTAEPISGQQLPFDAAGNGVDLAAAQAWLMQCVNNTQRSSSDSNSLLTSLTWRRDWATWGFGCVDRTIGRRAAALAALAGALCPEPERRLDAAMMQAGMSAERGVARWKSGENSQFASSKLTEPMLPLRKSLFSLEGGRLPTSDFADILYSPLRAYGGISVLVAQLGDHLELSWPALEPKSGLVTLASSYEITLSAVSNLARLNVKRAFGFVELNYVPETAGYCRARLDIPSWAPPLPKSAVPPRYSEPTL